MRWVERESAAGEGRHEDGAGTGVRWGRGGGRAGEHGGLRDSVVTAVGVWYTRERIDW